MKMWEIDTKPIEPVQVALTLFGQKNDQKKHRPGSSSDEMEKEKDIEMVEKELANYKVQLEAKDAAYLQLLHKLEHYQKSADELSLQLTNSEVEREMYFEECKEARVQVYELEAKVKEMADQVFETGKIKQQLSNVLCELKAVQEEVFSMQTELVAAREEKLKALKQVEIVENAAKIEKKRAEELLKSISELNQAISMSRQASFNAEKDIPGKKEEIRKEEEMIQELENQLLLKSGFIDSLQAKLNQANELLSSSDKVVSDVMNDFNKLQEEVRDREKENSDQSVYIRALESEMSELKLQLKNANEDATCLEKEKIDMEERENEAQVEIALVKAELHKLRSKLAAIEAEESEKETHKLRQEFDQAEAEKKIVENADKITISIKEYEALIRKADQSQIKDGDQFKEPERKYEVEILRKELEAGMAKLAEFRTRAEQAVTRAEAAERAKLSLENQISKWKEQKQRRKAALAALREESLSRQVYPASYDDAARICQPLGKVLKMKF